MIKYDAKKSGVWSISDGSNSYESKVLTDYTLLV